jgi:hypothetical protein
MSVPGTDLFLCLHMFVPDTNGFLRKGTVIPEHPVCPVGRDEGSALLVADAEHLRYILGVEPLFNAEHGKPLRKGLLFFVPPFYGSPFVFSFLSSMRFRIRCEKTPDSTYEMASAPYTPRAPKRFDPR